MSSLEYQNIQEYPNIPKLIFSHVNNSIETDVFIETLKKHQTDYHDKDIMNLHYKVIDTIILISREEGVTPLVFAIKLNHLETIEILIKDFNVDINLCVCGWTPIMVATYYSQIDIMNCLINAGVNIHCKNLLNNFNILSYAITSSTPKKKILYLRRKLSIENFTTLMNENSAGGMSPAI